MVVPSGMLIAVMPRRGRRRHVCAFLGAVLSLLALAAGLISPCLPVEAGNPAYYDGDEDDVGIVQGRFSWTPDVQVAPVVVRVVIPLVSRLEPPEDAAKPAPVTERGHPVLRAPPVSPA